MKSLVRRLATIGFVLGAGLAPLGCGSDSGSSGFDPLAGAGALAGAYDMTFQATVTFSAPPETPDQSFTTAALFTIEDGANGAVELTAGLKEMAAPLRGVIANRVHPLSGPRTLERDVLLAADADTNVTAWLQQTWASARALADVERERLDGFAKSLPADAAWVEVPELEHDAHSLEDLARLAGVLCSLPALSASSRR